MSDDRSIAEIIGWTPVVSRSGHTWFCPPEADWSDGSPPNVDDILAWVRTLNLTSFHFGIQGDGFYVDWGDDAAHDRTLLGALETAARQIQDARRTAAP